MAQWWLEPGDRGPITGMNVAPWLRWSCAGRGPAYWGMEHSAETAARKHRHDPLSISANTTSSLYFSGATDADAETLGCKLQDGHGSSYILHTHGHEFYLELV